MSADPARFESLRAGLLRHAYRMLGERAEAEDVLQDAFVRWIAVAHDVGDDRAFLRTAVTRLCIDRLRSARARREVYVGTWLPEPFVTDPADDPDARLERDDDVSFALLLALDRLSALERAAFLLHDVMGVPFAEIAETLGRTEGAAKQLASRARARIRSAAPRRRAPVAVALGVREKFAAAIRNDDLAALQEVLSEDVVFSSDSGGKAVSATVPVIGSDRVGRLLAGLARLAPNARVEAAFINDAPGYLVFDATGIVATLALDVSGDRIHAIYVTRHPEKLQHALTLRGAPPSAAGRPGL